MLGEQLLHGPLQHSGWQLSEVDNTLGLGGGVEDSTAAPRVRLRACESCNQFDHETAKEAKGRGTLPKLEA